MMAYDSQLVLCVLHKGSPVREIGRTVHLPFHSEYKIRLKNKHRALRTKAKVWVDGRLVSNLGDFILQPNETLDLERFLDESMARGRKFKFVPLGDDRVNDSTDPENGIIKVEFYRERWNNPPIGPILTINPIHPYWKGLPDGPNWVYTPTHTTDGYFNGTVDNTPDNRVTTSCFNSSISPINTSYTFESAGATVEGGHSGQSFTYGDDFETETYPITLELRVRGLDQRRVDWDDNPSIPFPKKKKRIKFCPSCGTKRHGMAKFCHSCGTAYHERYERERGRIVR